MQRMKSYIKEYTQQWQSISIKSKSQPATSPPQNRQNRQLDFVGKDIETNQEQLEKITSSLISKFPHCAIGAIILKDGYGSMTKGSAALISSNLIVTAAHVIFSRRLNKRCHQYLEKNQQIKKSNLHIAPNRKFFFYLRPNGIIKGDQGIEVQCWRFPTQYGSLECEYPHSYDYALLKLVDRIERSMPLAPSTSCYQCLLDINVEKQLGIYGYPFRQSGLPNLSCHLKKGEFQLYQQGLKGTNRVKLIRQQEDLFFYQLTTRPGQGGCPITFGDRFIGIHLGGHEIKQLNCGLIISDDVLDNLKKWALEMKGQLFSNTKNQNCPHSVLKIKFKVKPDKRLNYNFKGLYVLHLKEYIFLQELFALGNLVTRIDIKNNTNLLVLNLNNNKLSEIDLSKNILLQSLDISANHLIYIDLSNNRELETLHLQNNHLSTVNIDQNTKIRILYLNDNKLQTVDLTSNPSITWLHLQNNQIKGVNFCKNARLMLLDISCNRLEDVDLSENIDLNYLFLNNNQLKKVQLIENMYLKQLWLNDNQLYQIQFHFSQGMPWGSNYFRPCVDIANQRSLNCNVVVVCKREEDQLCKQFIQKGIKGYKGEKERTFKNQHKCSYNFQIDIYPQSTISE